MRKMAGPHKLRHFLSRAVRDEGLALDLAAGRATARLDDGDGILSRAATRETTGRPNVVGARDGEVRAA